VLSRLAERLRSAASSTCADASGESPVAAFGFAASVMLVGAVVLVSVRREN
jgi:hypothetical protein